MGQGCGRGGLNFLYSDRLMAAKRCKASISGKGIRYKKMHTVNLHSPATSVTGDCTLKVVEAVDRGVIGDANMRQHCRNIISRGGIRQRAPSAIAAAFSVCHETNVSSRKINVLQRCTTQTVGQFSAACNTAGGRRRVSLNFACSGRWTAARRYGAPLSRKGTRDKKIHGR